MLRRSSRVPAAGGVEPGGAPLTSALVWGRREDGLKELFQNCWGLKGCHISSPLLGWSVLWVILDGSNTQPCSAAQPFLGVSSSEPSGLVPLPVAPTFARVSFSEVYGAGLCLIFWREYKHPCFLPEEAGIMAPFGFDLLLNPTPHFPALTQIPK